MPVPNFCGFQWIATLSCVDARTVGFHGMFVY
jgi:hypothetical protein